MLLFERRTTEALQPSERPAGVSEQLAALLFARGACDAASMETFLDPLRFPLHDPFLLPDMDKAAKRLKQAVTNKERICVYGDYDADGVCAASILLLCLKSMGAEVGYHIPNRHAEGYGMNLDAIRRLAEEGVKLIVTVDNGIKSVAETELAQALGMEVIITDHHRCGDELPCCTALVCNSLAHSAYPNCDLCGAGIAYKLAAALVGEERARPYLILAGIATVADVVPLLNENRAIAAHAIKMLNAGEGPVGVKALLQAAAAKTINARALGFVLAPRLNAAGRLEDASLSVELLTCTDEARAAELAKKLDALNARRKKEEQEICSQAFEMAEETNLTCARGLVLKSDAWNSGVVGIAAARVAEKYWRPAVLFSERDGLLTGSARSIPGVNLHDALKRCESLFVRFGGHSYAAGVTMKAERFEEFAEAFDRALKDTAAESLFVPRKTYELELPLSAVNERFAEEIERLEPFGEGNPEPLIRSDGVRLMRLKRIGNDGAHLSLTAESGGAYKNAVGFFLGEKLGLALDADRADLIYTPKIDTYLGERTVKLHLADFKTAAVSDAESFLSARGEKFIDAFSRNVLYNNRCGFRATRVADAFETAAELMERNLAGVAALCFTESGAARFLRLAKARGLLEKLDVRFHQNEKSACGYHTLVLAPILEELSLSRYESVVVFDDPLLEGVLSRLNELAPDAELYVAEPLKGEAEPLIEALTMDRAFMASVFRACKAAERGFYNRSAALDHIAAATNAPRGKCALALDVMVELGFIEENKKGNLTLDPSPASRELMESKTFRAVDALKLDHAALPSK